MRTEVACFESVFAQEELLPAYGSSELGFRKSEVVSRDVTVLMSRLGCYACRGELIYWSECVGRSSVVNCETSESESWMEGAKVGRRNVLEPIP